MGAAGQALRAQKMSVYPVVSRGRRDHQRRRLCELSHRAQPDDEAGLVEARDVHVVGTGVELEVVDPVRLTALEQVEGLDVLVEEVAVRTCGRADRDLCDLRSDAGREAPCCRRVPVNVPDGSEDWRRWGGWRGRDQRSEDRQLPQPPDPAS